MTLKEIAEVVQHITHKDVIIDSSILEKTADQLSLAEVNAFIESTGVSLDFLATGVIKNSRDREIDREIEERLKRETEKKLLDALRQETVDYIKKQYPNHLDNFDFILQDGRIDGYKLLMLDDYDLYSIVSQKYKLHPNSIGLSDNQIQRRGNFVDWTTLEAAFPRLLGTTLKDYRFANFCINNKEIATRALSDLTQPGFDSAIVKLKAIILLIENGATLLDYSNSPEYLRPNYLLTTLLKDYCYRKIAELE